MTSMSRPAITERAITGCVTQPHFWIRSPWWVTMWSRGIGPNIAMRFIILIYKISSSEHTCAVAKHRFYDRCVEPVIKNIFFQRFHAVGIDLVDVTHSTANHDHV